MSWNEGLHPRSVDGKFKGGGHGSPVKTTRYAVHDGRGRQLGKVATPDHADKIAAYHRNNGVRGVTITKVQEEDRPSGRELAAMPDRDLSALRARAQAKGDHETAKAAGEALRARRRAEARAARAKR